MKCLSVSQPFAHLIITGKKRIELRNWNTNFRGEFLVHAPLKMKTKDCKRLKMNMKFVTGAIVGKAEIFDVKKYHNVSECKKDYTLHLASKEFQNKRYGFMLNNAKEFKIPIPCKGMLGFFEVGITKIEKRDVMIADIVDEDYRYRWVGRH